MHVSLIFDKNNRNLHEDQYMFFITSCLIEESGKKLECEMFQTNVVEKNSTHILFSIIFF